MSDFYHSRGKGYLKTVTGRNFPYPKDEYLSKLVTEKDFSKCDNCRRETATVNGKCRGCGEKK